MAKLPPDAPPHLRALAMKADEAGAMVDRIYEIARTDAARIYVDEKKPVDDQDLKSYILRGMEAHQELRKMARDQSLQAAAAADPRRIAEMAMARDAGQLAYDELQRRARAATEFDA